MPQRTDLAQEAWQLWKKDAGETTELSGVRAEDRTLYGQQATLVEILSEEGSSALCKPIGKYATLNLDSCFTREPEAMKNTCLAAAELIRSLAGPPADAPVLVAGLGNRNMTPDSIGPKTADSVLATKHLMGTEQIPEGYFSPVAVIQPGVLGPSGLESAEAVKALVNQLHPRLVIAVDALAAAEPDRLCRTLQVTDTGISPGSGVGNRRATLDKSSLGVPVIAVGVPTVIDAAAFCSGEENVYSGMMVTPKDIDLKVTEASKVAAMGINLALHPKLTYEEAELLLL